MKYSEIFESIQGEGRLVGTPSVFFRTSYCNLRCAWCDTPYTSWTPENRDISVREAFDAIHAPGIPHVVITGGEPFIQAGELLDVCDLLGEAEHHTTVETNAIIYAPIEAQLVSMSPKLSNSSPPKDTRAFAWHESRRIVPDVIQAFLRDHNCQVKFVVDRPEDLSEIDELVDLVPIPRDVVVLMPQGRTADEVRGRMAWLAHVAADSGYRLSPRLHVDLWGTQRGV
jgi:7-carboxy-7-deazaguanine synthase